MDTMNQSDHSNKPFSVRLIEDLTILLGCAFFASGLHMDSVEMDPVEDDEERVTACGDEFVFTIRTTAYYCSPKGRMQIDIPRKNGDQQ